MTQPIAEPDADAEGLFCPACGYDLRSTESGRCPECGGTFDRATLAVSRIPWVHRHSRGRFRSWWATLGMASWRPRELAREVARPVSWTDASGFRWIVVWILTLLIAGSMAGMYPLMDAHRTFREDSALGLSFAGPAPGVLWWYPLFALWDGPGIIAIAAAGSFVGLAGVSWWLRLWFWSLARHRKDRASAISCYVMARAIYVVILVLFDLLAFLMVVNYGDAIESRFGLFWPVIVLGVFNVAALFLILAGVMTVLRRSTQCGGIGTALAAVALPGGGLVIFTTCVSAVSYLLGLAAIAVYSIWG